MGALREKCDRLEEETDASLAGDLCSEPSFVLDMLSLEPAPIKNDVDCDCGRSVGALSPCVELASKPVPIRNDVDLTRHMDDAVQSLRICLAADESIRSGQPVSLGEYK